jgi:hypothetical protein
MTRKRRTLVPAPCLAIALAAIALAAPAATTAAKPRCVSDVALTRVWFKEIGPELQRLLKRQFDLVGEIGRAQGETVPPELAASMRRVSRQIAVFIDRSAARLRQMRPVSAWGRRFRSLALEYLTKVARPLNACTLEHFDVRTERELDALEACLQPIGERMTRITRQLQQLRATVKPAAGQRLRCPRR